MSSERSGMSINETKVVDIIAIPELEPDNVLLVIADHLQWGDKIEQGEHLLLLQEKINTYIAFIESGELLESYPSAKGKKPKIRINVLYEFPEQAELFITRVAEVLERAGIGFEFVLKADEAVRNM